VISIKEILGKAKSMVKVSTLGKMETSMTAIGKITMLVALDNL